MAKPMWLDEEREKASKYEWTMLEPGGHRLKIKGIEPTKSKTGLDMWIISFDTTEDDKQPAYYLNAYVNDTRPDKIWGGRSWLIVDENASSLLKTGEQFFYGRRNISNFTDAIEKSNFGFETDWSNDFRSAEFLAQFTEKLIGGVFVKEYYSNASGEARATTKLKYYRGIDGVEDAKIPEEIDRQAPKPAAGQAGAQGFMQLMDDTEEGIPFNV